MERVQADDRRRFLLMLESMYGDILTAKDLPEDIQEAEVDADVKAFAIAYAYAELADWMHDIRALPILPLADIPQNLRTRQKEREGLVVSSHDKLKEGILTAVQIRRQGDPVPQVITNKAGVPEFEWRRWFEKREP